MTKLKRQLLNSITSLLIIFTMFLGTTYAWFTDSAVSSGNVIQTGNLDVECYRSDDLISWEEVDGPIFDSDSREPGHTQVKYIKVVNSGSLSFKYSLRVIPKTADGDLSEVIDVYFGQRPFTRTMREWTALLSAS